MDEQQRVVVYRGVLQRSRLRLLLTALGTCEDTARTSNVFVWVSTKPIDAEQVSRLTTMLEGVPLSFRWEIIDGRIASFAGGRRRLAQLLTKCRTVAVVAVGQSSLVYLPRLAVPLVVCMNGVPEERLLQRPGGRSRAFVALSWAAYRISFAWQHRRPLVVTVSTRMSSLVRRRLGARETTEAPTAVGPEFFSSRGAADRPFDYCYQGSGAAWQNLDYLAEVWGQIHKLNPASRFLVASYDERCRVLGSNLPTESIDFCEAFEPGDVAELIGKAHVGFVLRENDVVNRVSFPTKIGESLACGLSLVLSDLDWDPADMLRGISEVALVKPGLSPAEVAQVSVGLRAQRSSRSDDLCRTEAVRLSREHIADALRTRAAAFLDTEKP